MRKIVASKRGYTMEVKSVGTFPVILVKLVPNKVELSAKSVEMSAFLASTLLGRVGGTTC